MAYTRAHNIGINYGVGLGNGALWMTDIKGLKSRLQAVKPGFLTTWETYRALENEFRQLPLRSESNLEAGSRKTAIIKLLNEKVAAIPGYYRNVKGEKLNPDKTWLAKQLIRTIDNCITVYNSVTEANKVLVAPAPSIPASIPTEPVQTGEKKVTGGRMPSVAPMGVSSTTILVGLGVIAAGYMLFMRKK